MFNMDTVLCDRRICLRAGRYWTALVIVWIVSSRQTAGKEYCKVESFNPSCSKENSVILMERAQYGRMKLGRCVTTAYGNVGCFKDVINLLDSMCSGRRACDVSVTEPALVRTMACPQDLSSYLDAEYTCQDVVQISRETCKHDGHHVNMKPQGFISPMITNRVRHESHARCPLILRAQPGQRISFTLYDFALRNDSALKPSSETYCQQYVTIHEPSRGSDVTICSGDERERDAYVSLGHEVTVKPAMSNDFPSFLLKYQVTGCPKLKTPEGTYARYDDDIVIVNCNSTRESFTLKCVNTTWTGELRNCTTPSPNVLDGSGGGSSLVSLPPIGISIVIIFGVAMVIVVYVAVMIVCVLYIKKKRRRRMHQINQSNAVSGPEVDRTKMADKTSDLQPEERLPMLSKTTVCSSSSECVDNCEYHEMAPCTVCNTCSSTYMSTKGVQKAREESAYGPARVLVTSGQSPRPFTSPRKQPLENIPRNVRNAGAGQSANTHPRGSTRPIAVVDSRMFAEGPYGFPPSYLRTFSKPVSSPVPPPGTLPAGSGGEAGITSPDIVPEYSTQNSTNTALAMATAKCNETPILQVTDEQS